MSGCLHSEVLFVAYNECSLWPILNAAKLRCTVGDFNPPIQVQEIQHYVIYIVYCMVGTQQTNLFARDGWIVSKRRHLSLGGCYDICIMNLVAIRKFLWLCNHHTICAYTVGYIPRLSLLYVQFSNLRQEPVAVGVYNGFLCGCHLMRDLPTCQIKWWYLHGNGCQCKPQNTKWASNAWHSCTVALFSVTSADLGSMNQILNGCWEWCQLVEWIGILKHT